MGEGNLPDALDWWMPYLEKLPGFVSGFVLGVISGFCGNWVWEKSRSLRKKPYLDIRIDGKGTCFSGSTGPGDQEQYAQMLKEITKPSQKSKGSLYHPPEGSDKTFLFPPEK